jgi:hypothetical protein
MNSIRISLPAIAMLALSACATSNPGWSGEGAVPFDGALAACEADVSAIAEEPVRMARLEECMAAKGWTRTPS